MKIYYNSKISSLIFSLIIFFLSGSMLAAERKAKDSPTPAIPVGSNTTNIQKWSDPESWIGNTKPRAKDDVVIPANSTVVLDENITVKSIRINGRLIVDLSKDISISAKYILIMGAGSYFEWGTPAEPYAEKGIITLRGTDPLELIPGTDVHSKAIMCMSGGTWEFHGKKKKSWTKLGRTSQAGATSITLSKAVDWQVGDEIVIASSDAYLFKNEDILKQNEERTITAISGNKKTITLNKPLEYYHYGKVQQYTNGTQNWTLDERAEVGLLTRHIKIQGNANSTTNGHGGHTMTMNGATAHISGVEFFRMGQKKLLGRYPFHWHLADDVDGQYIKNSTVHHAFNRAIVVHGTQNATVSDNTVHDVMGHAIMLEDAVETGCIFDGNLVMTVRRPTREDAVIGSDAGRHSGRVRGPGAFWITNPNNTFTNNAVAGVHGVAYWFGLPGAPTGPSAGTKILNPRKTPIKLFDSNSAHGAMVGFHQDHSNDDNATGAIYGVTNSRYNPPEWQQVTNLTVYKCYRGWWTRTSNKGIIFDRTILADCIGNGMTVSSFEGKTTNSLFVGHSDNNPGGTDFENKAISLYDGYTNAYDCHFVNFDGSQQAIYEFFGGASNKTNNVFTGCTFENVKMFNPDFIVPSSNKIMSVVHDADGLIAGTPFGGLCMGHKFLVDDENFFPVDGRHAYRSSKHFATLRVDYDRDDNNKKIGLSYVEWSGGHCIHLDEYNQGTLQLGVVPNIGRRYKMRFLEGVPPIVDIDFRFGRPGDVLDIQILDSSTPLDVATGAIKRKSAGGVYTSSKNAWAWVDGTLHLRMVASGGDMGVDGMKARSSVRVVTSSGQLATLNARKSRPYGGTGHRENTKIEAEWFDYGGLKVAYDRTVGGTRKYMATRPRELTDRRSGELLRLPEVEGKRVIGDIKSGNWVNYSYDIQKAGTYNFKINLSSGKNGNIKIKVDDTEKLNKDFTGTGGFATIDVGNLDISRGKHTITIEAGSSNFYIDWISLGTPNEIKDPEDPQSMLAVRAGNIPGSTRAEYNEKVVPGHISVYPNPANQALNVLDIEDGVPLQITDLNGRVILGTVTNERQVDISNLRSGSYILKIADQLPVRFIKE